MRLLWRREKCVGGGVALCAAEAAAAAAAAVEKVRAGGSCSSACAMRAAWISSSEGMLMGEIEGCG